MKLKTYHDLNIWLRSCQHEARHIKQSTIEPSISKRDIWRVWLSLLKENDFDDNLDEQLIEDVKKEFPYSCFSDYVSKNTCSETEIPGSVVKVSFMESKISDDWHQLIGNIYIEGEIFTYRCTCDFEIQGIGRCFTKGIEYDCIKVQGELYFKNDLGIKHCFGPDDGLETIFEKIKNQ